MLRRPPRSTLFPTRRSSDLEEGWDQYVASAANQAGPGVADPVKPKRSEEHTSELQSRGHLVCRLLLEKKKRNGRTSDQDAPRLAQPLHELRTAVTTLTDLHQ